MQCAITLSNLVNMKNTLLQMNEFKNQEQDKISKDLEQEVKLELKVPIQLSIDKQPRNLRLIIALKAFVEY